MHNLWGKSLLKEFVNFIELYIVLYELLLLK